MVKTAVGKHSSLSTECGREEQGRAWRERQPHRRMKHENGFEQEAVGRILLAARGGHLQAGGRLQRPWTSLFLFDFKSID